MQIRGVGLKSRVETVWCRLIYAAWPAFRILPPKAMPSNLRFSIGIATFKDRFDDLFAPLLRRVAHQFADTQVIVFANGHVDQDRQAEYLPRIEALCRGFSNVELHTSMQPRSLSSIWNFMIRNSRADRMLVLNDDLRITPHFRKSLVRAGFFETEVSTINNIWSHFLISRSVIERIGWFDEELLELGGEDDDYTFRLALAGVPLETRHCLHVWNESRPSRRNSYGHDMTGEYRYSKYNEERFAAKWIVARDAFPGSTYVARNQVHVSLRN